MKKKSSVKEFFVPTSRADWRKVEGDSDEVQAKALVCDSDDTGVMTIDVDGLESTMRSPVDALCNRVAFSPEAIAGSCLALRTDPLLKELSANAERQQCTGFRLRYARPDTCVNAGVKLTHPAG